MWNLRLRCRSGSVTIRLCTIALILCVTMGGASALAQAGPPNVGEGSLVFRSPTSGQYEIVPLTHTDVQIDVRGAVASATVTQQYANNASEPIEAIYIFPLPHDGAVYDLEMRIGERVIRSEIHEREEAKKVYEAAKSQGKHAALLEQERPNIFTTSIANIMPGDHIDVRLRYVEPLQWEQGRLRLTFPMVVGPRYIPGTQAVGHTGSGWAPDTNAVPDASRITPPVRNPDSRSGHDISVSVDLDAAMANAVISSVSHTIKVQKAADGRQHVELATAATLPNKDFVLDIQQPEGTQPMTALFLSPSTDSGETHFLLAAYPPTKQSGDRVPVEMLYMIDVSGSMEGTSIEQAREALLQALDRLRPIDRFSVLTFSSGYREFSPEILPATSQNLAAARDYVQHLQANGGTEMLPALMHLMTKPQTPGYLRHIVLLTDGDLGNEEQIFTALRQNLGDARLFTVAIGSAPNHYLAGKMAEYGRGSFTHIANINEVQEQMTRLFARIEHPVLTDVNVSFSGVEVAEVYPKHLPDLFFDQPLLIYGRITKGTKGTVHLTGKAGTAPYEQAIRFETSTATFHPGITTMWARQRVEELMDGWGIADQNAQSEIRSAVIAHALKYHLVTRFTSLVAVEQVVVNNSGASKSVPVPTELPAGWQRDKVFGPPATGTTDTFFEVLGFSFLLAGTAAWWLSRHRDAGAVA
jgi:Ca-activated chloride channel homolog